VATNTAPRAATRANVIFILRYCGHKLQLSWPAELMVRQRPIHCQGFFSSSETIAEVTA